MARSVNHRLRCEHLEERAVPADVGCAAAAAESAAPAEGDVITADDAFIGEDVKQVSGVLGGHRVEMEEQGTVVTVIPPEKTADADRVVVESEGIVLAAAPAEFNFPDEVVPRIRLNLIDVTESPKFVHAETHPAGRRITEGVLTWGVDALLAVDSVDVVKLILGSMGEACQAA